MPRFVVPIFVPAPPLSRSASSSRWTERISVALSAMRRFVAVDRDALPAQALDLGDERVRIEHDAVADDRELARAHDARRQERELVGLGADDEGVAGVVAALEAHDDVGLVGQPVDDLALALVAPLGANDHDVRHADPSREKPRREAGAFGEPCRLSSAMVAARSRRGVGAAAPLVAFPPPVRAPVRCRA